jgi:hypothetical protein
MLTGPECLLLAGSAPGGGAATDVLAGGVKNLGPRLLTLLDSLARSIKVGRPL